MRAKPKANPPVPKASRLNLSASCGFAASVGNNS